MSNHYYFVMVGREDNPLYQRGFSCKDANESENKYYYEFIAHASLDLLDELMWQTDHMFLKTIDKFNNMMVSAFVTPTGIKFLMVHDSKNEEDYVDTPGLIILKSFILKHINKNNEVHLLSYESTEEDYNLPSKVYFHKCFQDSLGWINGIPDSTPSLLKDIETNIEKQSDDIILVIDSLGHLLNNSKPNLSRDINKILNNLGLVKVKQLIALVHEDSIPGAHETMKSLNCIFKTHIDMLSETSALITHKKNSGKFFTQSDNFWWDKSSNELKSSEVKDTFEFKPPVTTEEPTSTFNLNLNDDEKLAREKLILPYLNVSSESTMLSSGGGGMIYIEPDDYDEEDPDDDLDV